MRERTQRVRLDERQISILSLLGQGLSPKEIGQRLGISDKTVRGHLRRAQNITGLVGYSNLATFALVTGVAPSKRCYTTKALASLPKPFQRTDAVRKLWERAI